MSHLQLDSILPAVLLVDSRAAMDPAWQSEQNNVPVRPQAQTAKLSNSTDSGVNDVQSQCSQLISKLGSALTGVAHSRKATESLLGTEDGFAKFYGFSTLMKLVSETQDEKPSG